MKKTTRFVICIYFKFISSEIEQIIQDLIEVLPKIILKRSTNYRNFSLKPKAILKAPSKPTLKIEQEEFLVDYEKKNCHTLKPVNSKNSKTKVTSK